jgi:hypothetical protein
MCRHTPTAQLSNGQAQQKILTTKFDVIERLLQDVIYLQLRVND